MDGNTGLVYMQARYYDPVVGRFLSVDPVGVDGGDMRHFNRYAYAYNSPYKFTDPDGRCPQCALVIWAVGALLYSEQSHAPAPGEATVDNSAGDALAAALPPAKAFAAVKIMAKGAEHTKNARPSTQAKHQAGQARKQRDGGGEKGDAARRPPGKRPPNHKGPWPPKPKPKEEKK